MKTKILFTIFTLCAAVCFTSCLDSTETGSSTGNTGTTVTVYELNVNNDSWQIYESKISLTDNAKKNPESYVYDYTLTVRAADASNMINADSKTLSFNFDTDSIEELKNEDLVNCENFHMLYRGKMETKASTYNYVSGRMVITEMDSKSMSIVFNNLKMKTEKDNLLLPNDETRELTISGSIKFAL